MCGYAAAIAVVGIVLSAYTSNEQSKTQKSNFRYNARESENEATRTRNQGVEAEMQHRQQVAQLQSKQKAQLGAANVDIQSGSALDIQEDAKLLGEVDALRIRSNFSNQASSLDKGAALSRNQAGAESSAAKGRAAGSLLQATGAGIQASGVSSQWYNPNSSAVTGTQANSQFGNIA